MSGRGGSTLGTIIFVLFGPVVWAGHLLAIYGGHASPCAFEMLQLSGLPVLQFLLAAATIGALAVLGVGLLRPEQVRLLLAAGGVSETENAWLMVLMRLLAGLSLLGVAYAGLAILLVPNCLPLR